MSKFYLHIKTWEREDNDPVSGACVILAFGVNHTGSSASSFHQLFCCLVLKLVVRTKLLLPTIQGC